MKWGWFQFNNYGLTNGDAIPEWTSHLMYKGRIENRFSQNHTGIVAEFGRHCDKKHIIRVDLESMYVHGPDDVEANGGKCFDDVVAEFRYSRFGIATTYQLCGELGTNHWKAEKADL